MRRTLLLLISCVCLVACKNKNGIPGDVLPQKKMQAVLWDMMRADQFLTDYVINKDTTANRDTESIKLYREIFAIHQVTKKEFQRSFAFYNAHPAFLKPIMDSIAVIKSDSIKAKDAKRDSMRQVIKKTFLQPDSLPGRKKQPKVESAVPVFHRPGSLILPLNIYQ